MIAATALTARRLGMRDREGARRIAGASMGLADALSVLLALLLLLSARDVLALLGADGRVAEAAHGYLMITLPSNILMALGMGFSGVLRAVWVTPTGRCT